MSKRIARLIAIVISGVLVLAMLASLVLPFL